MTPALVGRLLWFRIRAQWQQVLLMVAGIAIGVALVFAVLTANGSIAKSSDEIVAGIVGDADLQLQSRDQHGFDERIERLVTATPGVVKVAGLLDQRAVIAGPGGQVAVNVASASPESVAMSPGLAGAILAPDAVNAFRQVIVTSSVADGAGLPKPARDPHALVTIKARGRAIELPLGARLSEELIGPLASATVAVVPLKTMQEKLHMDGKLTRILVDAEPGQVAAVQAQLTRIADDFHLALGPAQQETALLKEALGPSDLTSGFFATLAAVLGGLLAFNAALLGVAEQRKHVAQLREDGYRSGELAVAVCSQAVIFAGVASLAGLTAGTLLAQSVFDATPGYLSPAFVPGSRTIVQLWPAAVAACGGLVAALVAVGPVLLDLRSRNIERASGHDAASGQAIAGSSRVALTVAALAALAAGSILLAVAPGMALVAAGLIAVATVLFVPVMLAAFAAALHVAAERVLSSPTWLVAFFALRSTALRNTALAATGAVAVFGVVAVAGARDDLLSGIDRYAKDYVATADVWVVNPNDNQATNAITIPRVRERIAAIPGVAAARAYSGSFLDEGRRRLWIIGRDANDREMLPASQMLDGDLADATRQIRDDGAVAVSDAFARSRGLGVGDTLMLDTPTGARRWEIAALTTNLGWTPGAVIMSRDSYQRAWRTVAPSAIEVDLAEGASRDRVQAAIRRELGSGVVVQSAAVRQAGIEASARQGLRQLQQISMLLLGGAVLALATAMGAAIWRRRVDLAKLAADGWRPIELWTVLLTEAAVVLAAGCFTGMIFGIWGQVAADSYIRESTGFPVDISPGGWATAATFVAVIGGALLLVAIPSWRASRAPLSIGARG